MNTLLDILAFNREYASPRMTASDRGWWVAGVALAALFLLSALGAWINAWATTSTSVQSSSHPRIVVHATR